MIDLLEPLAELPGVRRVLFVTRDGVPIAACGTDPQEGGPAAAFPRSGAAVSSGNDVGRDDALAGLAVSWLDEIAGALAPLSWEPPRWVVLRAARGALVSRRMKNAVLVLFLSRGVSPEDVRLPLDGTVARIERALRAASPSSRMADSRGPAVPVDDLPGPLPARPASPAVLREEYLGDT